MAQYWYSTVQYQYWVARSPNWYPVPITVPSFKMGTLGSAIHKLVAYVLVFWQFNAPHPRTASSDIAHRISAASSDIIHCNSTACTGAPSCFLHHIDRPLIYCNLYYHLVLKSNLSCCHHFIPVLPVQNNLHCCQPLCSPTCPMITNLFSSLSIRRDSFYAELDRRL